MKLEKLYKKADKNSKNFREIAHTVIWDEVISDEENKEVIAGFTARDMAIGEILTRNKYLAAGLVVGIGLTIACYVSYGRIKKFRKEIEEV